MFINNLFVKIYAYVVIIKNNSIFKLFLASIICSVLMYKLVSNETVRSFILSLENIRVVDDYFLNGCERWKRKKLNFKNKTCSKCV